MNMSRFTKRFVLFRNCLFPSSVKREDPQETRRQA